MDLHELTAIARQLLAEANITPSKPSQPSQPSKPAGGAPEKKSPYQFDSEDKVPSSYTWIQVDPAKIGTSGAEDTAEKVKGAGINVGFAKSNFGKVSIATNTPRQAIGAALEKLGYDPEESSSVAGGREDNGLPTDQEKQARPGVEAGGMQNQALDQRKKLNDVGVTSPTSDPAQAGADAPQKGGFVEVPGKPAPQQVEHGGGSKDPNEFEFEVNSPEAINALHKAGIHVKAYGSAPDGTNQFLRVDAADKDKVRDWMTKHGFDENEVQQYHSAHDQKVQSGGADAQGGLAQVVKDLADVVASLKNPQAQEPSDYEKTADKFEKSKDRLSKGQKFGKKTIAGFEEDDLSAGAGFEWDADQEAYTIDIADQDTADAAIEDLEAFGMDREEAEDVLGVKHSESIQSEGEADAESDDDVEDDGFDELQSYRDRLKEIEEEMASAEEDGDEDYMEKLEREADDIEQEIARIEDEGEQGAAEQDEIDQGITPSAEETDGEEEVSDEDAELADLYDYEQELLDNDDSDDEELASVQAKIKEKEAAKAKGSGAPKSDVDAAKDALSGGPGQNAEALYKDGEEPESVPNDSSRQIAWRQEPSTPEEDALWEKEKEKLRAGGLEAILNAARRIGNPKQEKVYKRRQELYAMANELERPENERKIKAEWDSLPDFGDEDEINPFKHIPQRTLSSLTYNYSGGKNNNAARWTKLKKHLDAGKSIGQLSRTDREKLAKDAAAEVKNFEREAKSAKSPDDKERMLKLARVFKNVLKQTKTDRPYNSIEPQKSSGAPKSGAPKSDAPTSDGQDEEGLLKSLGVDSAPEKSKYSGAMTYEIPTSKTSQKDLVKKFTEAGWKQNRFNANWLTSPDGSKTMELATDRRDLERGTFRIQIAPLKKADSAGKASDVDAAKAALSNEIPGVDPKKQGIQKVDPKDFKGREEGDPTDVMAGIQANKAAGVSSKPKRTFKLDKEVARKLNTLGLDVSQFSPDGKYTVSGLDNPKALSVFQRAAELYGFDPDELEVDADAEVKRQRDQIAKQSADSDAAANASPLSKPKPKMKRGSKVSFGGKDFNKIDQSDIDELSKITDMGVLNTILRKLTKSGESYDKARASQLMQVWDMQQKGVKSKSRRVSESRLDDFDKFEDWRLAAKGFGCQITARGGSVRTQDQIWVATKNGKEMGRFSQEDREGWIDAPELDVAELMESAWEDSDELEIEGLSEDRDWGSSDWTAAIKRFLPMIRPGAHPEDVPDVDDIVDAARDVASFYDNVFSPNSLIQMTVARGLTPSGLGSVFSKALRIAESRKRR